MLESLIRYVSIAICAIVLLSFAMFISDQSSAGTAKEVATLNDENDNPVAGATNVTQQAPKPAAPKQHGQPRKAIDDADKKILSPFDGLVSSTSGKWARRGVPSFLALLVFGFGLQLLAGYLPKPKTA